MKNYCPAWKIHRLHCNCLQGRFFLSDIYCDHSESNRLCSAGGYGCSPLCGNRIGNEACTGDLLHVSDDYSANSRRFVLLYLCRDYYRKRGDVSHKCHQLNTCTGRFDRRLCCVFLCFEYHENPQTCHHRRQIGRRLLRKEVSI